MNWTKEQSDAITDRGGTLLVSAAAGSGKTAVLVERAVRLMLDEENPVPADRILIVTFTRAAAEELRGRIGARLAAEQTARLNDLNLRRQRLLLGRASISTIDAFCMQLLKQHFNELSIPPDFNKADEALVSAMRAQACSQTLEEMYTDEAFCTLASMYGRSRSDNDISDAVLKVYDFLRSAALPDKMAQNIEEMWTKPRPVNETKWGEELFRQALLLTESAIGLSASAKEIALANDILHYVPALESDYSSMQNLIKPIKDKNWDAAYAAANSYQAEAFQVKRGFKSKEAEAIKLLRDKFKKTVDKLCDGVFVCTEKEYYEDVKTAAPLISSLLKAAKRFEEIFYAKKLEEKVLEYSDFEHLARKLLATNEGEKTKTAMAVSARFDAVMIDEYQDTNELQALLYSCLANDDGSNLFMVGDVKQSIYRFRLAEPGIFVKKKDSYKPYGEGYPAVINLGHNFRSAESIVDQINYVFSEVMSRELGGVDYTEGEKLVAKGGQGFFGAPTTIKIVKTSTGKAEAADANEVAKTIEGMVKSGFSVREQDKTRPSRYGDYCVLLRTRSSILKYAAALEARGIPCVADTSDDTLISPEVSPLLSLLRIIDNPGQDVYMSAVLLSPMYSFKPEDLLALRKKKGSLYAALCSDKSEASVKAAEDIKYFRFVSACAPFTQLVEAILNRTHYLSAVSAMPEGAIRRENLRTFIAYSADACAAAGGLSSFLRRLDSSKGAIAGLDNEVKTSRGAVSIMTIHKSKGLEFPVCILANTQHSFNQKSYISNMILNPELGLGLSLCAQSGSLYSTLAHRALALSERRECVSEEMRVLYVALTRARDKLVITMSKTEVDSFLDGLALPLMCGKKAKDMLLQSATNMSVWICAAALLHPMSEELIKTGLGALLRPHVDEGCKIESFIIDESEEQTEEQPRRLRTAQPDEELLNELKREFEISVRRSPKKQLPVKLSVSALAKKDTKKILSRPSFTQEQGLTAAEKGTAMHSVLQFIDFEKARQDLDAELMRLDENGYVESSHIQKLDKTALVSFLQSELISRAKSAERVLREYDFIADFDNIEDMSGSILVQGIADLVIIRDNSIEIADYKTDKGKTSKQLTEQYKKQLYMYSDAISRRLGLKITRLTIYSFALSEEINVPLL